jgi:hypothetical protein
MKQGKSQPTNGRKYFQIIYLLRASTTQQQKEKKSQIPQLKSWQKT